MRSDDPTLPARLAAELREAMGPLWRELNAHRTVSVVRVGALGRLARGGRATAAELAAHEHVTPQAMTTVLRDFEEAGLVVRTPDVEDRRRVWNEVTEAGRAALAEYLVAGNEWLAETLAERLDEDERAALAAVLPLLRRLTGEGSDD